MPQGEDAKGAETVSGAIGIDPGASGAICFLSDDGFDFLDTTVDANYAIAGMIYFAGKHGISSCTIEKVHAIPGSSAKATFGFGGSFSRVLTLAEGAGLGVDLVTPKTWQKGIGISLPKGLSGAERKYALKLSVADIVSGLYPSAYKALRGPRGGLLDGRSDALAIAHYALKQAGEH